MAFGHGSLAKFYYHTFDFSAQLEGVESNLERDAAEVTPLGSTWGSSYPGVRRAMLSLRGIYDGAANQGVAKAWASFNDGTGRPFAHLPQGDTIGAYGYCGQAMVSGCNVTTPSTEVARWPWAVVGSDAADRVRILRTLSASVAAGSAASQDNTAPTSTGGCGYLICTVLTAGITLAVLIEQSSNNSDWTTLVDFTDLTAIGSEAVEVAGAVPRYLRATWTGPDASHSCTFFVAFGRR